MNLVIGILLCALTTHGLARSFSVMHYNVENFFDLKHDLNTEDWTYLPLALKRSIPGFKEICAQLGKESYVQECLNLDWNEAKFLKKIHSVSRVVRAYDNTGRGPDIVVFEEVENVNVLTQLVREGLYGLGYHYRVLLEGDDSRGIDVGLISKHPIIAARRYPIFSNGKKLNTRGILEVTLSVLGHKIIVYGNHWPSQSNPTEERIASALTLQSMALKQKADLIIAVGDFNTLNSERPLPFDFMNDFFDAELPARQVQRYLFPGTRFHKGEWSSFDRIFIFKNAIITPKYEKFKIIAHPFMMEWDAKLRQYIPISYNHETGEGYSDHLPVGMIFETERSSFD